MIQRRTSRLYAGFQAALVFSGLSVLAVLGLALQIYRTQQAILHEDVDSVIQIQRLRYRVERQVSTERAFLLTGFPTFRRRLELGPEIARIIRSLSGRGAAPERELLLAEVSRQVDLYETDLARLRSGRWSKDSALSIFENQLQPRRNALFQPLERLIQLEYEELQNAKASAKRYGRWSLILGAVMAAGLVAALLATGAFVRRSLLALERERKSLEAAKADLEKLVAERTRNLERAVQQLEAFGYSVAHDLRAPARTIAIFSEAVLRKEASLDEDTRGFFHRIKEAGQRMRLMLDGLLTLSRISQEKLSLGPVDLAVIARRRLDELAAQEPERRVEVRVADSIPVQGDARLLEILLQNLLENAWKFTLDRPDARIEAGSETRDGVRVHFVRDNGRGFDPALNQRLFKPFHRLPNAEGIPGLGIGLASASRIADAHGGKIWVESMPGAGTTFFFTLSDPK
ncbi:MAG: hypothetical protein HY925_16740 [Elusimicrobia bacterium]|nr:hypothetical protein [Elusimicrobiota bacterium]